MAKRKKSSKQVPSRKSNSPPASKTSDMVEGHHQITQSYSGPLPHPSYLEGYERVLPGCADRIVVMAEESAKHHREQNERQSEQTDRLIDIYENEVKRGQWMVFSLATLCIVLAALLYFYIDNVYVGGALLFTGILFIIRYLVEGIISRRFQVEKESDNLENR